MFARKVHFFRYACEKNRHPDLVGTPFFYRYASLKTKLFVSNTCFRSDNKYHCHQCSIFKIIDENPLISRTLVQHFKNLQDYCDIKPSYIYFFYGTYNQFVPVLSLIIYLNYR